MSVPGGVFYHGTGQTLEGGWAFDNKQLVVVWIQPQEPGCGHSAVLGGGDTGWAAFIPYGPNCLANSGVLVFPGQAVGDRQTEQHSEHCVGGRA